MLTVTEETITYVITYNKQDSVPKSVHISLWDAINVSLPDESNLFARKSRKCYRTIFEQTRITHDGTEHTLEEWADQFHMMKCRLKTLMLKVQKWGAFTTHRAAYTATIDLLSRGWDGSEKWEV